MYIAIPGWLISEPGIAIYIYGFLNVNRLLPHATMH